MSDIVFNLLYPILNTLMFLLNFPIFIDVRKHYKSYSFYFFITYLLTLVLIDEKNILLLMMTIVTFIYFKYINVDIITITLTYFLVIFSILLGDALCGFIIEKIFNYSYEYFSQNNTLYFMAGIMIIFFSFIFTLLIKRTISNLDFSFTKVLFNKFTKRIFLITTVLFIALFSLFRVVIFDYVDRNFPVLYMVSSLTLLGIICLLYYLTNSTINISIKKDYAEKENKQLKEYTDMLEKMSTDLRKFKHDYVNILYTLGDYINEGDIDGLKKYYHEDLLPESKNIVKSDKHITLIKNIKITPLKALISSKLLAAQSEGIEINAEVLEEIDKLSIKTIDICRIIGIFLDNAIEASLLCKKKFVHIAIIKTEGNVIIVIMNSCPKNIPPVYQLYKKNFSTKGENRGIGLTSVKELIDNCYKNILLNTSASNGVFKQELIIKN